MEKWVKETPTNKANKASPKKQLIQEPCKEGTEKVKGSNTVSSHEWPNNTNFSPVTIESWNTGKQWKHK